MNVHALIPLIATVAYIPLLASTVSSRPLSRRHVLFILFLLPAMMWSLSDYLFRSHFFPQLSLPLLKTVLISFTLMGVQLHAFTSSFFAPRQGRWLIFAYTSLAITCVLMAMDYIVDGITLTDNKLYPHYNIGILFIAFTLLVLAMRNYYVFGKRLKTLDNPALYNQIISLLIGITLLSAFALVSLLPTGREYPIPHIGNLASAFILSYAAMRHQLVDIKIVLRKGSAFLTLGIIGAITYWVLLVILHSLFSFQLDLTATFTATALAVAVAILIYRLRGLLFSMVSRMLQGRSYDYRQQLSDFANKIQNIFSLKGQGGELLALITKAIDCKRACLLFPETGSEDFMAQVTEPKENNPLSSLRLRGGNPIINYLARERKPLTRENLATLPEFLSLWEQEKKEIKSSEIELFLPLISRDRLISILVIGKRQSGRYSLEDFYLLEDITDRVAVSMEKEYLQDQLKEREEELSVINRCSTIITSNFDIQGIYASFIDELKTVIDVNWGAIILIEENDLYFLALYSDVGSAWQKGERIASKSTATEWVATHKKAIFEPDLLRESSFATAEYHIKHGIRSIIYLPLIAKGEAIGSLTIASKRPNAYNARQTMLLKQLATQIAMPVENARLYAKAEEKARIDELSGLLNRRSLDETLASEIGRHSRYGGIFSLIILDLDSFKAFNDNYGHLAGDKLLKQASNIMKGAIRNADQAFRYGGDEFAIVLPQTSIDAATQVAERIRKQVALKIKSGYVPVTASIGLATWPADGIGPDELIAAADAALYHAKRSGGNRTHCISGTLLPLDNLTTTPESKQESEALSTIYSLAATVDARDHYTRNHSKRVREYAQIMADALNLKTAEKSRLENCALLHDIGKVCISDDILNKPDKLTSEEMDKIKQHPQFGATIVSRARRLAPCVAGILHHHERYDGSGYPRGLKGEDIPLEARILSIVDTFAAVTSDRPYAKAVPFEEALQEIKRGAGTQFDPNLVGVFLSIAKTTSLLPLEKKGGGGKV